MGGLGGQKCKRLENLPNVWTDWHKIWYTSADSYGNGHSYAVCGPIGAKFGTHMQIHLEKVVGKLKFALCDLGGTWGVLGVRNCKMGEICQTAGQIGIKFGTHADSSGNEHRLKNNHPLENPGGILRGLCGQKLKPGKRGQTASLIAG